MGKLFGDINSEVEAIGVTSCPAWTDATANIKRAEDLLIIPGGMITSEGILGCFEGNKRVELILTTICQDFYDPMILLFELFCVFGALLFFSEILQKCLRVEDSSASYNDSGYVSSYNPRDSAVETTV